MSKYKVTNSEGILFNVSADEVDLTATYMAVNTDTLYVDILNSRVGIGNSSPTAALDIEVPVGSLNPLALYENRVGGAIVGDSISLSFAFNDSDGNRQNSSVGIVSRVIGTGSGTVSTSLTLGDVLQVQEDGNVLFSQNATTDGAIAFVEIDNDSGGPATALLITGSGDTASQTLLQVRNNSGNSALYINGENKVVFNNNAIATADVQMKGDVDANMFYANAGTDSVGIGTASPGSKLHIVASGYTDAIRFATTTSVGASGHGIYLTNDGVLTSGGTKMGIRAELSNTWTNGFSNAIYGRILSSVGGNSTYGAVGFTQGVATTNVGVRGVASGSGTNNYGGEFIAQNASSTTKYAVYASASQAGTTNYGLWVSAADATTNYAIYVNAGGVRLGTLTTTPAAGYVLQSIDANGNADWVDPTTLAGGETLAETLAIGNSTGANDIILTAGQVIRSSSGGGQLHLNDTGSSRWSLTSDNSAYGAGSAWTYGQANNGSQLAYQITASEAIGFGAYESGISPALFAGKEITVQDNTSSTANSGNIDKRASFVSARNGSISTGVINTAVIGGTNISAAASNALYTNNLRLQSSTNTFDGSLVLDALTATRTYTLQNASGTLAFLSDITDGIYSGSGTVPTSTAVTLTDTINFDTNTFVIDGTNNNVGIGTGAPTTTAKLHISPTTAFNYSAYTTMSGSSSGTKQGYFAGMYVSGTAENYGANFDAGGSTSGRNRGVRALARNSSTGNVAIEGSTWGTVVLSGDIAVLGFNSNSASTTATSTYASYFDNRQTNSASKYGQYITLLSDQASGTGYGQRINLDSTFTSGTSYGSYIDVGGTTPTKYGQYIIVNEISTTNYGIRVDVTQATNNYALVTNNGDVIFNEAGGTSTVRIEGDTDQNLFYSDATNDRIGIGHSDPQEKLSVAGNISFDSGAARTLSVDLVTVGNGDALTITAGTSTAAAATGGALTLQGGAATVAGGTGGVVNINGGQGSGGATDIANIIMQLNGGRVGIGTNSPDAPLHISDGGSEPTWSTQEAAIFQKNDTAFEDCRVVILAAGNSILDFADSTAQNAGQIDYNHSNDSMTLNVNTGTNGILINSDGVVEVGQGLAYNTRYDSSSVTSSIALTVQEHVIIAETISGRTTGTIAYDFPDFTTDGVVDGHEIIIRTLALPGTVTIQCSTDGIRQLGSSIVQTTTIALTANSSYQYVYSSSLGYWIQTK